MFGPHLIIDGSKCDIAKLNDRLLIERLLTEYPRAIGMTRIGGPYMFEYQAPDPAYSGVSGLVVIAESHIAIHTFPNLDFFTMDIFSCKNFDHEVAISYIREALGVKEMDRMLVQRGLTFRGPHHGPLGATDELLAAASARNEGIGSTIGSIPLDDPLYPREAQPDAGRMLWPAYGLTPDLGTYQADAALVTGGMRDGATVIAANAAAAGEIAMSGFIPVQPVPLNPTASTSGVIERMTALGGQGRLLGKALDRWEAAARAAVTPVVLALGPGLIAEGARDLVADLIHRGHVSAIIAEGDTLIADAYESLGYRHYVREDAEEATPVRGEAEWTLAQDRLTELLTGTSGNVAATLGEKLRQSAPRPGVLTAAAEHHIPVFATGQTGLSEFGVTIDSDQSALTSFLGQSGVTVVALGVTEATSTLLANVATIAIGPAMVNGALVTCRVDAALALPLLATGLAQRLPKRPSVSASDAKATPERTLQPVG